MDSKKELQTLIRNHSVLKNVPHFGHRRATRAEKSSNSISPGSKQVAPSTFSHSRPKSQLSLTKVINLSSYRIKKLKRCHNLHSEATEISNLLDQNTLNQNPESLNTDKHQIHLDCLSQIRNINSVKTLLDYNFETIQESKPNNLLSTLLALAQKGPPSLASPSKKDQLKIVDVSNFRRNVFCVKCTNSFLVKHSFEDFVCEECSKGNVLKKITGTMVQVSTHPVPQKSPVKTPSQDMFTLFTDRSVNVTPNKTRFRKAEDIDSSILNIILPAKYSECFEEAEENFEFIEAVKKVKEKGKLLSRDLVSLIQEQKEFSVTRIKEIEDTIGEYAKRLRIILKELNEFIPEFSQSLELIFKGHVIGIDSLIQSFNQELKKNQEIQTKMQEKLCDQEILKTEVRKLKAEMSHVNKKHTEDSDYLKAVIDRYKFTVSLYRKELDAKEENSLSPVKYKPN